MARVKSHRRVRSPQGASLKSAEKIFFNFLGAQRYAILVSVELDPELEDVLRQLFKACDEFQIAPRLIGGLAVRGHTNRKRYTHDIDLAVGREDKATLIAILKSMGFEYRDQTAFGGVKAWQQIGKVMVELHISVDILLDNPELDANAFWENCQRTGNIDHILRRLDEVEQMLKDDTFRQQWQGYYPEDINLPETLSVIRMVESLKKAKP
jgi:hypothetical protein